MTRPTKAKAIERLRRALDAIPKLKNLSYASPEFEKWRRDTKVAIINTFGNESNHISDFTNIRFYSLVLSHDDSLDQARYVEGLESAAAVLESMIEEINEYWGDENQTPTPSETHRMNR